VDVILRDILVFLQSGNIWRHVLDLIDIGPVSYTHLTLPTICSV